MTKTTNTDAIASKAKLTWHGSFIAVSTKGTDIIGVIQSGGGWSGKGKSICHDGWYWTAFHSNTEKPCSRRYRSANRAHHALIRDAIKAGAIT